jgi:hypothetical protein
MVLHLKQYFSIQKTFNIATVGAETLAAGGKYTCDMNPPQEIFGHGVSSSRTKSNKDLKSYGHHIQCSKCDYDSQDVLERWSCVGGKYKYSLINII